MYSILCTGYLRKEATFLLPWPWVRSFYCASKNFFLFFDANSLDRQYSERGHGNRKVAQFKIQQFHSLDSQGIHLQARKEVFADIRNAKFKCGFHT